MMERFVIKLAILTFLVPSILGAVQNWCVSVGTPSDDYGYQIIQ